MEWKDKSQKLLEAHVKYELSRLDRETMLASVSSDLSLVYDWIGSQKMNRVFNREKSIEFIKREMAENNAVDETLTFLDAAVESILKAGMARTESVADLLDKAAYDSCIELVITSKDLREDFSREFARSLFFRRLISEILFFSLKAFLTEDNVFAQKIPGVSSLFKFGQNLVNKTMPGLDENVSRTVKDFINGNMDNVVKYTESIMTNQMDEKLLRELASDFWNDFSKRPASKLASDFNEMRGPHMNEAVRSFWIAFKKTEFFAELISASVRAWFDRYGEMELRSMLPLVGWNRERTIQALAEAIAPVIEEGIQSGQLESLIRERLKGFYSSELAAAVFA